jgi:hypothetical protein
VAVTVAIAIAASAATIGLTTQFPSTFIVELIFPECGKSCAGLGFHIVPPHVLGAGTIRPNVFAADAASMTPDAFVEVKDH